MSSHRVLDYGFKLDAHAIAPATDILWHMAGKRGQAAFWRQSARIGHGVFQLQMQSGVDRLGRAFAPLAEKTIEHRRSAMGHADKNAPPFIPAHELSRTVSYLRARVLHDGVWFYWLMDPRVKARWGKILDYHRRGVVAGAPIRDVFGFAPNSIARIKQEMTAWWLANRQKITHEAMGVTLRPESNLALQIDRLGAIGQPKPVKPATPSPRYVEVTGTTHRDTFDGQHTTEPLIINGRRVTVSRRSGANDVSKLRNAPIPPKRRRAN